MTSLSQTILDDERARVAQRAAQETEHLERRRRAVDALTEAVGPDADPAPIAQLAATLDVDAAVLAEVLRAAVAAGLPR